MYQDRVNKMINGDGLLDDFYTILWSKSEGGEAFKYAFYLPQTITFRDGKINSWFFSNNDKQVLRKKSANINDQEILSVFKKFKKNKSKIVATLMYAQDIPDKKIQFSKIQSDKSRLNSQANSRKQSAGSYSNISQQSIQIEKYIKHEKPCEKVITDYLSYEELEKFIHEDDQLSIDPKKQLAIIQEFIEPDHENNNIIKCIWSPTIQIFEKRYNNKNINDLRVTPYERAVTFDADDFYSYNSKLKSPQVSQRLRYSLDQIKKHVQAITFEKYKLRRMVAFFKIDRDQHLYLLWCNSIRSTMELKKLNKNTQFKQYKEQKLQQYLSERPIVMDLPSQNPEKKKIFSLFSNKAVNMDLCQECERCKTKNTKDDMTELPYKYLIQGYNEGPQDITTIENKVKIQKFNSQVGQPLSNLQSSLKMPVEFHTIYPKMTQDDYNYYKDIPQFLSRTLQVCKECYLHIVGFQKEISGTEDKWNTNYKETKTCEHLLKEQNGNILDQPEIQLRSAQLYEQQVKELYPVMHKAQYKMDRSKVMQGYFTDRVEIKNLKERQKDREIELNHQLKKENIVKRNRQSLLEFRSHGDQKLLNLKKKTLQKQYNTRNNSIGEFYQFKDLNSSDNDIFQMEQIPLKQNKQQSYNTSKYVDEGNSTTIGINSFNNLRILSPQQNNLFDQTCKSFNNQGIQSTKSAVNSNNNNNNKIIFSQTNYGCFGSTRKNQGQLKNNLYSTQIKNKDQQQSSQFNQDNSNNNSNSSKIEDSSNNSNIDNQYKKIPKLQLDQIKNNQKEREISLKEVQKGKRKVKNNNTNRENNSQSSLRQRVGHNKNSSLISNKQFNSTCIGQNTDSTMIGYQNNQKGSNNTSILSQIYKPQDPQNQRFFINKTSRNSPQKNINFKQSKKQSLHSMYVNNPELQIKQ